MRIAIDAHTFSPNEMTGGDVYVHNLVRELAAIDSEDRFLVLLNAFSKATSEIARQVLEEVDGPNFAYVTSRLPSCLPERLFNAWYYGVTVPRALKRHEMDVFFGANYYGDTKGAVRLARGLTSSTYTLGRPDSRLTANCTFISPMTFNSRAMAQVASRISLTTGPARL